MWIGDGDDNGGVYGVYMGTLLVRWLMVAGPLWYRAHVSRHIVVCVVIITI